MNLRRAKFEDHWRHVFRRRYPTRLTSLSFTKLYCLSDADVEFSSGINVIVGGNGVGKSTVSIAIAELLAEEPDVIGHEYGPRLQGSEIRGTAFVEDAEIHPVVKDSPEGRVSSGDKFTGECRRLDPSDLATTCVHKIQADHNFDDLLESVSPIELPDDDLRIASYLVGKKYDAIRIFEIDDYGGLETFPYFDVSVDGLDYGSEGMGRGELALLLLYWTLRDMSAKSILVLEEPETHVSPFSQDCLMNILAKVSDERSIWTIITTHSPTIIRNIPREHIKLLVREPGHASKFHKASKLDIAILLGGGVAYRGAMLVEDKGAQQFVEALLEQLDPDLLRQFEVVAAGSESSITAILKAMPRSRNGLSLYGAYDGDMRGALAGADLGWPYGFLPGDAAPEEILCSLESENLSVELGTELGRPALEMTMALGHAEGADHHDYFGQFASATNLEKAVVVRGFAKVWLSRPENQEAAKEFLKAFKASSGIE